MAEILELLVDPEATCESLQEQQEQLVKLVAAYNAAMQGLAGEEREKQKFQLAIFASRVEALRLTLMQAMKSSGQNRNEQGKEPNSAENWSVNLIFRLCN